jgi:hypothetical protein
MIPARDRTELLGKTLASVLTQDQGERLMQIEVIDNSERTRDVPRVVTERGGSRVAVFRQLCRWGWSRTGTPAWLGPAAPSSTCFTTTT